MNSRVLTFHSSEEGAPVKPCSYLISTCPSESPDVQLVTVTGLQEDCENVESFVFKGEPEAALDDATKRLKDLHPGLRFTQEGDQ